MKNNLKILNRDIVIASGLVLLLLTIIRSIVSVIVDPFLPMAFLVGIFFLSLLIFLAFPPDRLLKAKKGGKRYINYYIILSIFIVIAAIFSRSILISIKSAVITTFLLTTIFTIFAYYLKNFEKFNR